MSSQRMCEGRVCIVTGAGRGLGREYALSLAQHGAKVVVNDLGGSRDGTGADAGPAQEVVDEITAAGGEAAANTDDISSLGRCREPRPAGDRHLRRPRRPREQRRHPPRPDAVLDDRRGVGRRHPRAPQGHVRAQPPRRRLLARALEGGRDGRRRDSSTPRRCRVSTPTSARPTTARPRPASPRSRRSPRRSCRATASPSTRSARARSPGSPATSR